jgi:hypothetical protein
VQEVNDDSEDTTYMPGIQVPFTAQHLKKLVECVIHHGPYLATQKNKGQLWIKILAELQSAGIWLNSDVADLQKKVDGIIGNHLVCQVVGGLHSC